jgi:hypothetical protein
MSGIVFAPTLDPEQDRVESGSIAATLHLGTPQTPGWILRIRAARDLADGYVEAEKWTPATETNIEILAGTAKSNLGTYHLIAMNGALTLLLEASDETYDLAALLELDHISGPITAIAKQWQAHVEEAQTLLANLPATAALPVCELRTPDAWLRSSGEQGIYLSYSSNGADIQVVCARPSEEPNTYEVKLRVSPELPWRNVTKSVESTPAAHAAVTALVSKAC